MPEVEAPASDAHPPPMRWSGYVARAVADYRAILDAGSGERRMQAFFEQHCPFVPMAFPLGGHGPLFDVMITQPPLKGFGGRTPDFMWLTRNSGELRPVLVEIEDPNKRYVTGPSNDRRASADVQQALNQLRQWRQWFEESGNKEVFLDTYGIEGKFRPPRRRFIPIYVLIYGRSSEGNEAPKIRSWLREQHDAQILTYDGLQPRPAQRNCITVTSKGRGKYEARAMPACAQILPTYPDWWEAIEGRAAMIERNEWISPERNARLLELLREWDSWAGRKLREEERRQSLLDLKGSHSVSDVVEHVRRFGLEN